MRSYTHICLLTVVSAAFSPPTSSAGDHLEFYKELNYPWVDKEGPLCLNETLCPQNPNYTWSSYFKYFLDKGVKNFVLGGLIMARSSIWFSGAFHSFDQWNLSAFIALRKEVRARGGRILGDLHDQQVEREGSFNKTLFRENVDKFLQHFPVDGFRIKDFLPYSEQTTQHVKEALEVFNEMKLTSSIRVQPSQLDAFAKAKLGGIPKTTFLSLWPKYCDKEETIAFNTDKFAEQAIKNATVAGVDPSKIVLEVPLLVRASCSDDLFGYSMAIYQYHQDPQGNGMFHTKDGDYYFFSQPRATDKTKVAREHGLHGIALRESVIFRRDLFPWDKNSLFYALLSSV